MFTSFKIVGSVVLCATCTCWLVAGESQLRSMKYTSKSEDQAIAWQKELRSEFARLLKIDDLISRETEIPYRAKTLSSVEREKYTYHEMELNSTPGRRIQIVLTVPRNLQGPFPAVLCVAGHGGKKESPYKPAGYHQFAHLLAEKGYVTISTSVSRHEVYEKGRTLMGERLWDLMRCVDFLTSRKEVDPKRIGCAGLSLGGEMVMWLGAMDERVKATVSSGFLTKMDQMEKNHCMCWKFPGLRELVDFADIYSMTAPRALLCQNGLKEPPSQFFVPIAREALSEIKVVYADFKKPENLAFVAHKGGHEIDVPSLMAFFEKQLEGSD